MSFNERTKFEKEREQTVQLHPSELNPLEKKNALTTQDVNKGNLYEFSKLTDSAKTLSFASFASQESLEEPVPQEKEDLRTPALNTTPIQNSPFLTQNYSNLVSEASNSRVLFATDEWFCPADNLIKDGPPIFVPDLYCEQGKVMDGWESRRRRDAGHDWCVIALGPMGGGDIYGVELDTAHFTGNQTPRISIHAMNCNAQSDDDLYNWMPGAVRRLAQGGGIQGTKKSHDSVLEADEVCKQFEWTEILPMTELQPGYEETRMHYFELDDHVCHKATGITHIRVNYFPDGGVARLRLWGYPSSQESKECIGGNALPSAKDYCHPELSLDSNGGKGLACSNKHYGVPDYLIQKSYGKDMGDGWETARNPLRPPILVKDPVTQLVDSPLMDWAVLKLGMGGTKEGISRIILDTKHFKGNYPESVLVEGCCASDTNASDESVCAATPERNDTAVEWFPLLPRNKMGPDQEHEFLEQDLVNTTRDVSHLRVRIYPDGGLSRVRVYGPAAGIEP